MLDYAFDLAIGILIVAPPIITGWGAFRLIRWRLFKISASARGTIALLFWTTNAAAIFIHECLPAVWDWVVTGITPALDALPLTPLPTFALITIHVGSMIAFLSIGTPPRGTEPSTVKFSAVDP